MSEFDKVSDREEYVDLSGIRHFAYCKRCWSLARIDGVWADNMYTIDGKHHHEKTDDVYARETRKGMFYSRGMPVVSDVYKVQGVLDTVEFYQDVNGVEIQGRDGLWIPKVVEYKRSYTKDEDIKGARLLQLIGEVVCLEEMLGVTIDTGYLYYRKQNRRDEVRIGEEERIRLLDTVKEMYACISRGEIIQERRVHKGDKDALKVFCNVRSGGVGEYKERLYRGLT